MNNSQMVQILTLVLIFFVAVLFTVIGILVIKKLMKNHKKLSKV